MEIDGPIKFKKARPKDVTDRITSVVDAIEELGEEDEEVVIYRLMIKVLVASSHPVRQQQAIIIVKALNEGWVWKDGEYAYTPYFTRGSAGFRFGDFNCWSSDSHVGSRLELRTPELATYAGETFVDTYKSFMVLN